MTHQNIIVREFTQSLANVIGKVEYAWKENEVLILKPQEVYCPIQSFLTTLAGIKSTQPEELLDEFSLKEILLECCIATGLICELSEIHTLKSGKYKITLNLHYPVNQTAS